MRKMFSFALCGVFLAPILAFSGCGGGGKQTSYTIRAEYFPEERRLSAVMDARIVNTSDNAWEELRFSLAPNAYREGAKYAPVSELYAPAAYYDGVSYGGIAVSSVEGAAGFEVCGEDENVLAVALEEPLYPDETAEISVAFEVTLAKIDHRLGVGERAVNLANFYPVLEIYGENGFCDLVYAPYGDPFVTACADYDVTLTVPAEYTVCGAATREERNGKAVCSLHAENVRDVAFVLGTEFEQITQAVGDVPVTYYYLDDGEASRTLAAACDSLSYYEETFGEYAYPQYTVVQTDFPYGGMEYPMLSMIARDLKSGDVPLVVAHETAHQWWYAMVGSDQYNEAWQDEGLAEFSTALFLDEYPGYGGSYADMVAASELSYRSFYSVHAQVSGDADTRMSKPLTAYSGEYEYRNLAYDKGVILFDNLRTAAGDRRFFAALSDYCGRFCGKIASPADMVACFHRKGVRVEELVTSFTEGKCII